MISKNLIRISVNVDPGNYQILKSLSRQNLSNVFLCEVINNFCLKQIN